MSFLRGARLALAAGWCGLSMVASGNVFGPDRRVAVDNRLPPFRAIGLVRQLAPGAHGDVVVETCTGTLVGARLVLTAAHCVARDGAALSRTIRTVFLPAGVGAAFVATDVASGEWRGESDSRAGDWAFLLLDRAPGIAPMPVDAQPARTGDGIAVFGYSGDFGRGRELSADLRCSVRDVMADGVLHHDCGTYAGASGGPALRFVDGRPFIVGVHSAHQSGGTRGLHLPAWDGHRANLVTAASRFLPKLAELERPPAPPPELARGE